MVQIEFKPSGKELAKVLHYFGLLEGSGEFKIICPFHDDINPSMLINLNDGIFHCFGCQKSGDALAFVKYMYPKKDDLFLLKKYYCILKSKKVKNIIFNRKKMYKLSDEHALNIAHDYYFGLKTIDWFKVDCQEKEYMRKRGFLSSSLNKCKAKLTYSNINYPIIFPMFDMGEFKGWVCRTTNKRIEEKRKYLYNEGFSRANTLVGKYDSSVVMLVEGYIDWLKMKQLGVKKVAAILGWKITEPQIQKLKKQRVKTIISALDNDECGEKGTKYLKKFFNVIRFEFPEGIKDPGDLNKKQFEIINKKIQKELFKHG